MSGPSVAGAGIAAFSLTTMTAYALGRLALRWGITDRPGGYKAHHRPIPYLGGLAIALGTVLPAFALLGFTDRRVTAIVIGALAIALLGLIDDLTPLPAGTRLLVEAVTASGVVLSGVEVFVTRSWLDVPITLLWIVVMTNSFNLLDNMDGALSAVTAVTALCLSCSALVGAQPAVALLLLTLALACLGFLPHNWAPAKIFMGDAGSLFIGFVLACSAALLVTGQDRSMTVAGLLLPTFVASVDTGVVLVSRARAGLPLLSGGTDHLAHRLRHLGLGTQLTAVTLATLGAITGLSGLAVALHWVAPLPVAILAIGAAVLLITLPQRVPVYSRGPLPTRTSTTPERHP